MKNLFQPGASTRPVSGRVTTAVALALGAGVWAGACGSAAAQPAPVYPTDLTNIAAAANGGRVLSATSVIDNDAAFKADNLIDGQIYKSANQGSAGWASNKFDPVNMDSVTLGFAGNALRRIGKIALNPTSAVTPERWAKDVEVQVSTDSAEGPYRAVAQLTLRRAAERQEFLILPAPARFVRLLFRSNWGSDRAVALGEVEIYEAIGQGDAIGQLIARLEGAINDLNRYRDLQAEIGNVTGGLAPASLRPGAPASSAGKTTIARGSAASSIASLASAKVAEGKPARSSAAAPVSGKVGKTPATISKPAKPGSAALSPATLQLIQETQGAAPPAAGQPATPAATGDVPAGRVNVAAGNIAAAANGGRIVDYSSIFNNDPAYGPDKLIDAQNYSLADDKGSPGWASEGFTPGRQFVTIGFRDDRTRLISKLILNPVSNQSSLRWASRVEVQVTTGSARQGRFAPSLRSTSGRSRRIRTSRFAPSKPSMCVSSSPPTGRAIRCRRPIPPSVPTARFRWAKSKSTSRLPAPATWKPSSDALIRSW